MLSITRKQNNKYMDRFINEYREMVGQKVAYNRGEHGLLAISRILKEKKLLGVLYDQDTNDDGVDLKLFGKDSIIPLGAAALSRIYDVTQELVVILEHEIISHPEMWFWVHDRWKDGRERFAVRK